MGILQDILIGLLLLQAILLLSPVIAVIRPLKRANARNNAFYITMSDRQSYHLKAVLAQEYYELIQKRNVINLFRRLFSTRYQRQLEIMGHEIESIAAAEWYGENMAKYRNREAKIMASGYECFKGRDDIWIRDQMIQNHEKAADWFHQHKGCILKLAESTTHRTTKP